MSQAAQPTTSLSHVDISLVLATCSRAHLLQGALESLLAQQTAATFELIVVDDGSTDHTAQLLAATQQASAIPIRIFAGTRQGVAAARNLAAAQARGTFLASFDDDQIALPGWLEALYHAAQDHAAQDQAARDHAAACVGGALLLQLPPGHSLESLGPRTRSILGEHTLAHSGEQVVPYPRGIRPATNNVLIRRDVFHALGGYDTSFTEGAEDADFFDRASAAGHILYFQPAAQALHIIPPARLEPRSLRWTSLRVGAGDARLHHRRQPTLGPLKLAAQRLAVTVLRDLPQLAWATLRGDARTRLDVLCSLWYTQGLLRALPAFLSARQDSPFLRSLNFRARNGERPS